MRYFLPFALVAGLPAFAEPPRVVVDIAPIHGIVSRIMDGVGVPEQVVPANVSPHDHALRPSEVRAFNAAELIVWVSPDIAPSVDKVIDTLNGETRVVTLVDLPETELLPYRESAIFDDHDDHDEHHDEDEHDDDHAGQDDEHEDHDDHDDKHDEDHAEHADDHDEDGEAHAHDDHHHHGEFDPHVWLDPGNALAWLTPLTAALSELDPENATVYEKNADAARSEINAAMTEANALLEPVRSKTFVVFHDAYHYYEDAFDISALGSIELGDATSPGAARIIALQDAVQDRDATCVFAEPQYNPGLVAAVAEAKEMREGILDPLGSSLDLGPGFYPALIVDIATQLRSCLQDPA